MFVLQGPAGTGKTFLTNAFLDVIQLPVVGIAPTHKAKGVLKEKINHNRFIPIDTMTIASALSKMREHSYVGTKRFSGNSTQKINKYSILILDETSMIADRDFEILESFVVANKKKLVCIGDPYQIPAPSQPLVKKGSVVVKKMASAFSYPSVYLNEIVRSDDSFILETADYIRKRINKPIRLEATDNEPFDDGVVVCYTNAAVERWCEHYRKDYKTMLVEGEKLMGYENIGFPVPHVENGTIYEVKNLEFTDKWSIEGWKNLKGYSAFLNDTIVFFIDPKSTANQDILQEVGQRAARVNAIGSTKKDFVMYKKLKDQMCFLEPLYKFRDQIYTRNRLKKLHPLLFTHTDLVIDTNQIVESRLTEQIVQKYPNLLKDRLDDRFKTITEGELLVDRFAIIDRDLYYAYAMTAHKSQGSTFDYVSVDLNDFDVIKTRYNHRWGCPEDRTREKNELLYVACTRASKDLALFRK